MPRVETKSNYGKISKSYILTPPNPKGMWCQWCVSNPYLNLQSKFGYCTTTQTLNIALCKWDRITVLDKHTDGWTKGQTDRQTDRQTDDTIPRCPSIPSWGIKIVRRPRVLASCKAPWNFIQRFQRRSKLEAQGPCTGHRSIISRSCRIFFYEYYTRSIKNFGSTTYQYRYR